MKRVCLFVLSITVCVWSIEHDFKGFDDSILFGIVWPGTLEVPDKLLDGEAKSEAVPELQINGTIEVTSSQKEKYKCLLPELKPKQSTTIGDYDGPSPVNLLKPLFSQKICSYRLESYWSYEVCHGRYIRQYHEERDGKTVKTQEFFLGYWSDEKQSQLEDSWKLALETKETPKTTKVEGVALPYVEMVLDAGTKCDLNDKKRLTRLLYVCYSHGRHEVYSFKETSTCEYEIIILSPLLCQHPQFKPKEAAENIINCLPVGDAPKKPRNLLKSEVESLKFHHQTVRLLSEDKDARDVLAVLKVEKIDKDGETHLKFEIHPLSEDETIADSSKTTPLLDTPSPVTDDSPVRAFLNGENCLNGGSGWWKYEFCYGKHVVQYHVDRAGEKATLLLGKFDEQTHLDWIKENPGKVPKPVDERTSVTHFYSDGDVCDKTGKPRQTEVKLKCLENSSSPAQVSLYLLEPRCALFAGERTSVTHFYSDGDVCDKTGKPRQTEVKLKCLENSSSPAQVSLYLLEPRCALFAGERTSVTHFYSDGDVCDKTGKPRQTEVKLKCLENSSSPAQVPLYLLEPRCALFAGERTSVTHFYSDGDVCDKTGKPRQTEVKLKCLENSSSPAQVSLYLLEPRCALFAGERTSVTHFYSDGDVCDKTGKPRQTEVKLKCLENSSSHAQVSLYLLEPRTCHYILGVESPLICNILPLADDNGLIKSKALPLAADAGADVTHEDGGDEQKHVDTLGLD